MSSYHSKASIHSVNSICLKRINHSYPAFHKLLRVIANFPIIFSIWPPWWSITVPTHGTWSHIIRDNYWQRWSLCFPKQSVSIEHEKHLSCLQSVMIMEEMCLPPASFNRLRTREYSIINARQLTAMNTWCRLSVIKNQRYKAHRTRKAYEKE